MYAREVVQQISTKTAVTGGTHVEEGVAAAFNTHVVSEYGSMRPHNHVLNKVTVKLNHKSKDMGENANPQED